ncbi:MAG: pseudouridine synthase [Spartobacteria bacterium]
MRLNRFLAAAGLGSRRHCDELIADGRVTINGHPCTNFSTQVEPSDHVKVGQRIVRPAESLTIALHKPAGFVCTRHDPNATDTIYDLLPPKFSRLFSIGRLDAQTEGLLLLTSDGDLSQHLTHPRYKVEKEYEVTLDRRWDAKFAPNLLKGVYLGGKRARLERVQPIGPNRLRVVLQQGINRQIHRMFYEVGYDVERLVRIRLGHLRLGEMPRASWRPLTKSELSTLRQSTSSRKIAKGGVLPRP